VSWRYTKVEGIVADRGSQGRGDEGAPVEVAEKVKVRLDSIWKWKEKSSAKNLWAWERRWAGRRRWCGGGMEVTSWRLVTDVMGFSVAVMRRQVLVEGLSGKPED
jgi:hypothetical protein